MSDQAGHSAGDDLYVEARFHGTEAAIVLVGEFDMAGTERFWGALSEVLGTCPRSVVVEARGLMFIDSSGLLALARARDAATEAGVAFRLTEPSSALRRIVELCGLQELLSD